MRAVLLCLVSLLSLLSPARAEPPKEAAREVRLQILNLDGTPAAGRAVHLRGLSRGSTAPAQAPWDFSTDTEGRLTLRFLKGKTWEQINERPGWGNYVVVVPEKEGQDAGAISPIIMNVGEADGSTFGGGRQPNPWGTPFLLTDDGADLTLKIVKGTTVRGTVWNYEKTTQPLAGVVVNLHLDLRSESHTGYGGEILHQRTTTDARGGYEFTHVHPGEVFLTVGEPATKDTDSYHWLKTKLNKGEWTDAPLFGIPLPPHGLSVDLAVSRGNLFRYWGQVTDEDGKPVSGAKITFGISFHPSPETHVDSHTFVDATSGKEGRYEILLPTPWVTGMRATLGKTLQAERWDSPEAYPPGEYSFKLKP